MYALITGASSGIGQQMAFILSKEYDLLLVARDDKKLMQTKEEINKLSNHSIITYSCDVSNQTECKKLYNEVKDLDIEILINGAGFGVYGDFVHTSMDTEVEMIDTNVIGMHILTKLFLRSMVERNHGYILNIASSAGYMPGGPKMAGYYATKAYVVSLTNSIHQELKMQKSDVYVGALCPGPVKTNFNRRAGVHQDLHGITAEYCARYGIKKMFQKKRMIIPGFSIKWTYVGKKLLPDSLLLKMAGKIQSKKDN